VDLLGIEAWIGSMSAEGARATTVLRAHGVLSGVLADAVKSKRLSANPAKGVENLPRKTARRHVYLSADDVHRLASESGDHGALVLLLAFCGLRWGEAIALRVRDVEFLRRRLMVSENAVQLGVDHAVGPTKGRTARSVPVPTFVLDELSQHCKDKASDALVFRAGMVATNLDRSPQTDGSRLQSGGQRFSRSRLMTLDIRARASRSVPGSMFCPSNGCSDTSQRRSLSTPTATSSMPTSTQ